MSANTANIQVSVVVPLFNEQEMISELYEQVSTVLESTGRSWELVLVDDGSRDRTLELALQLQQQHPEVTVVELTRNWGHQPAISAGLSVARGAAVVCLDADLQDPPQTIVQMLAKWDAGAQVVIAKRRSRAEVGLRGLCFKVFYKVLGFMSDYPIPLDSGIFGLIDREVVDAINRLRETNRYLPGLRAWVGFRTDVVLYDRSDRYAGEPKQGFFRLLRYGLDAIFSFSYKPLRMSLVMGCLTALAALAYGAILFYFRLKGTGMFGLPVVHGYTSTILSILFLAAVQLISVGIVGEYLGRIYDEVKHRPLFLIRKLHAGEPNS